jgi:hypothetical protein
MQIERTNNEILIRIASDTDLSGLQRVVDFIRFREITSKSKASQTEIDSLASESKADWWGKNKKQLIK